MSLYIAVFSNDESDDEVDGVDVGSLEDYNAFRALITAEFRDGEGKRGLPLLLESADNQPGWRAEDVPALLDEIEVVRQAFMSRPAHDFGDGAWQARVLARLGVRPRSLNESVVDVDGEPLLDRLAALARAAIGLQRPVEFT